MAIAAMPWLAHGSLAGPGTLAVSGVAMSVAEVTNLTVGVILAVVGVAGGVAGLLRVNRDRRREMEQARRDYEHEIEAAERRGEDRYRPDMEYWRGMTVAHLMTLGLPVPAPPSQREGE